MLAMCFFCIHTTSDGDCVFMSHTNEQCLRFGLIKVDAHKCEWIFFANKSQQITGTKRMHKRTQRTPNRPKCSSSDGDHRWLPSRALLPLLLQKSIKTMNRTRLHRCPNGNNAHLFWTNALASLGKTKSKSIFAYNVVL